MSTTPRTDAHYDARIADGCVGIDPDFARQLEREMEEARESATKAESVVGIHMMETRRMAEELSAAKNHIEQLGITLHKSERELEQAKADRARAAMEERNKCLATMERQKRALQKARAALKICPLGLMVIQAITAIDVALEESK